MVLYVLVLRKQPRFKQTSETVSAKHQTTQIHWSLRQLGWQQQMPDAHTRLVCGITANLVCALMTVRLDYGNALLSRHYHWTTVTRQCGFETCVWLTFAWRCYCYSCDIWATLAASRFLHTILFQAMPALSFNCYQQSSNVHNGSHVAVSTLSSSSTMLHLARLPGTWNASEVQHSSCQGR